MGHKSARRGGRNTKPRKPSKLRQELTADSIDNAGNAAPTAVNPTTSANSVDLTNTTPPTCATESAAPSPSPSHTSWAPNLESIDSPPRSSTIDLIHTTDPPVPKPTDYGQNHAPTPTNAQYLNKQLRKWGLQIKRLPSPSSVGTEKIHVGEEIVEYEIMGFKGESRSWILNTLAVAAEENRANRPKKERNEEKAEAKAEAASAAAAVAAAQDDEKEDGKMDENEAATMADTAALTACWNSNGKTPEGASGQIDHAGVSGEGSERKGSGPPLGIFYEDETPTDMSTERK